MNSVAQLPALAQRLTYNTVSQIQDLIYYNPAWFALGVMFLYHFVRWLFWSSSKKRFTPELCTNIVITGAVQGLGKLLAEQFVRRNRPGSINLIVIDIREDLAAQLVKDIKTVVGIATFKRVHFYRANLADVESTASTWDKIIQDHGPVHILVNNHARCLGKRFEDVPIDQFKLTMDINFNSYVHLCQLFLSQPQTKDQIEGQRFHLVNVNSIAGHMTCQRNSDYSASKFALTGFTDALRQELEFKASPVRMTNVYPYYINTGLFEGFQPTLGWILPTLKGEKVASRMYHAITCEEKEVYIDPIIWYIKVSINFLPLSLRNKALQLLVGQGMEYFQGRCQEFFTNGTLDKKK